VCWCQMSMDCLHGKMFAWRVSITVACATKAPAFMSQGKHTEHINARDGDNPETCMKVCIEE
jgi:hypothetical protein